MKRHADCACNPVHCDATDTTSLWPTDGTLTDQQTVVARLLGMTVRGGRVRASVAAWGTVLAVVGLIEEGRGTTGMPRNRPESRSDGLTGQKRPPILGTAQDDLGETA